MINRELGILKGMILDIEADARRAFAGFDIEACDRVIARMGQVASQAGQVAERAKEVAGVARAARAAQYTGSPGATPPAGPRPPKKRLKGP